MRTYIKEKDLFKRLYIIVFLICLCCMGCVSDGQSGNADGVRDAEQAETSEIPGEIGQTVDAGLPEGAEQTGNTEQTDNTAHQGSIDVLNTGNMEMTADQYVVPMGVGINLGNTMEAYWEDLSNRTGGTQTIGDNTPGQYERCWGAIDTTKEIIDGIRDAGFSTVRIPVYWGNMMADDGTFTINDAYIGRVKELVDYCLEDGLYVVINIHHYDQFLIENYPQEKVLEITESLWLQIGEYFKDYPEQLLFEGFNEALGMTGPEGQLSEEQMYSFVNSMNRTFVDAVRSTGGNNALRVLIVSGYWTNIDATTDARFQMPVDTVENRLMVSVHYVDNACYWMNTVGNGAWLDYCKSQCEALKNAFLNQGIPVFIGECTAIYSAEHFAYDAEMTESSECLQTVLDMIVDYGMIPVLWDTCDQFYSRTDCRIASERDGAVIEEVSERIRERDS